MSNRALFPTAFGLCMVCFVLGAYGADSGAADLREGFVRPPASARPHTWWHWMNGNVTKEGITADLEAMARAGVGGAQIFNAHCGIPEGPVDFNSPEWLALTKHAAAEARRLGVELCIHNCAGWSSSGGPWNTPENSMKIVVFTETLFDGPLHFEGQLPQPRTNLDFYRDIAVLVFPIPAPELVRMGDASPEVTVSAPREDPSRLIDGKTSTLVQLGMPGPKSPSFIQFRFPQPFTARLLSLTPTGAMQACNGVLEVSDDGLEFRTIRNISLGKGGSVRTFSFDPVSASVFRVRFTSADRKMRRLPFAEAELSTRLAIGNLAGKTFQDRGGDMSRGDDGPVFPDEIVSRGQIQDLTSSMGKDGSLTWQVPDGHWTVMRIGYTANGRKNHPAPAAGTGLECDKLSREAAQAHWDGMMGKVLAELGPLAGNADSGLNNVLIDSYEVGCQNWTAGFAEEFRKRRGYDLTRFLPVFSGRVVDSPDITERFLWDFRKTVADLFAENYSGAFAEMAHRAGLQYSVEPYGNGPFNDLQYGNCCDIPMSEFWTGGTSPGNAKLAASLAHVYGRKYVGAESFTASPEAGKWLKDPFSLKAQGDVVYCAGVNRIIYHRYAHQPWMDRFPGMTMGQWGTHFERTLTWWEQGRDWLTYQARCQFLLQEGLFVADVCFYCGEGTPVGLRTEKLPPGYDFDGCDTRALELMSVKDGRIVLPSGMSYRILSLPRDTMMTPRVLQKVKELVDAGATVIGGKPEKSPSLVDYPVCDAQVKRLAEDIWSHGARDCSATEAITGLGIPPDFSHADTVNPLSYIHRVMGDTDVYFVASRRQVSCEVACTFRMTGRAPELWHPDSGRMEAAPVFREENGCTTIPLRFDPAGSVFVVFRGPVQGDHAVEVATHTSRVVAPRPVYELRIEKAEYGVFEEEQPKDWVDVTALVRDAVAAGDRQIQASNSLAGDPVPNIRKQMKVVITVGNEEKSLIADEHQTVDIPEGATVKKAIYGLIDADRPAPENTIVDVTGKLASLVKDGTLVTHVDNSLAGRDPAYLVVKELRVEYMYKGIHKRARVKENQTLILPEENEQVTPPPVYELEAGPGGDLSLAAWQPGDFEVRMASGATRQVTVAAVPDPVAVAGPWDLSFPPNWGAPPRVSLETLISWTEYPDNGVKYFSGTATYSRTFAWSGPEAGADTQILLDLGDVRNFAEVELNGRDLGILWKPPFRIDVTKAIKAGDNALRVKITNLWPNRLIGDEQLPPDCKWSGKQLKEWPDWLLAGKPSPTGRLTFTTWHHWTKDDEPLPSGLLGPVQLRTVKCVTVR